MSPRSSLARTSPWTAACAPTSPTSRTSAETSRAARVSVAGAEVRAARVAAAAELLVQRGVVLPAHRGARQRVEELDGLRLLVRRDVAPAVLDELCRGHRGRPVEDHDGLHILQEALVRYADHRGLLHRWVSFQAVLHLGGEDVLRPGLEHPGHRAEEGERAVRLAPPEVGGVPPAEAEPLLVDLGAVPVAQVHRVAAQADLAGLADRAFPAVGVEDPHPRHGGWPAGVPRALAAVPADHGEAGDLGLPVAVAHPAAIAAVAALVR